MVFHQSLTFMCVWLSSKTQQDPFAELRNENNILRSMHDIILHSMMTLRSIFDWMKVIVLC